MPAIQLGSKVLVSGANGYLAIWIIKTLLDKGYSVRGTVRSANKGEHLTKIFSSYGSKFELTVVKDITAVLSFRYLWLKRNIFSSFKIKQSRTVLSTKPSRV
jgi:nucleoside-diphosphate-sugar epimerase